MARITRKTRAATGALLFAGAATWRRRARARTGPIPPETPGTSAAPPPAPEPAGGHPAQDPDDDILIAREESAAAAEAGRIGGRVTPQSDDPALEPLYEAGEGEQEGWEAAEAELVDNASHSDGRGVPARDAFTPERESDRSTAAYGEADEEEPADS